MNKVAEALRVLTTKSWKLSGNPTSKTEFESCFEVVTGADENNDAIYSNNPKDFGVTWSQIQTEIARQESELPLQQLREVRNIKLAETDWWVVSDRTATPEQLSYRQALRDITETYTSLNDVVWPVKP